MRLARADASIGLVMQVAQAYIHRIDLRARFNVANNRFTHLAFVERQQVRCAPAPGSRAVCAPRGTRKRATLQTQDGPVTPRVTRMHFRGEGLGSSTGRSGEI